jgi:hypothetical protein
MLIKLYHSQTDLITDKKNEMKVEMNNTLKLNKYEPEPFNDR